jgi:hypothetical protein
MRPHPKPVLVTLSAAVLIVGACSAKPTAANRPAGAGRASVALPADVVHLQGGGGIATVGDESGRWTVSGAVATPDWSTMFNVEAGRLRTLDGVTGAERASQPVRSGLRPVVASADGRFVALTDSPAQVGQGVLPPGRAHSTVVVAAAGPAGGRMHTIELDGNIVPEGFSTDHAQLFVIEFLPPMNPDRYRVRSLDIATGRIGPVYTFDKVIDTEVMQGLSRTQVFSGTGPFGPMLYTLYSRADGPGDYAALHALSLDSGLVHCTDFPPSLHIGPAGGAIAVTPDGRRVFVAGEDGTVAEIDTAGSSGSSQGPFPILRTTRLRPGAGAGTVAVTADNHTVWVALGTHLAALDATDLRQIRAVTVSVPVHALAITERQTLYAATSGIVEVVDPATGAATTVTTIDTTVDTTIDTAIGTAISTAPTRLAVEALPSSGHLDARK